MVNKRFCGLVIVLLVWVFSGCTKLVEISDPVNTITTSQTFSSDANAIAAIAQIYSDMIIGYQGGSFSIGNGIVTGYAGLSADELNNFTSNSNMLQIQNNTILSSNNSFYGVLWSAAYGDIYYANAAIEGLQASKTVSDAVKKQLIGEAKFVRAFMHFYLVNLFGDIPLMTTTSWASTSLMVRTSKDDVYKQIVTDLKDAQDLLVSDYSSFGNERVRPVKAAASALLARVYLYTKEWQNAVAQASAVINNSVLYGLADSPANVFGKNNKESIWQLYISNAISPYATVEGNRFIPSNNTSAPTYYLTKGLLDAFEAGDKRKTAWTSSTVYQSTTYYYPYKYNLRQGTANGTVNQYYTVLRLGEVFLIRAEAEAQLNLLQDAKADMDTLRVRAGLPKTTAATQGNILDSIARERRIELFAEWGHRWLDLKRTSQADVVLPLVKPQWQPIQKLYPIPLQEIQSNPNLSQNPGYN